MAIFDFRDASLKGSPTWSQVGLFPSLAPLLVFNLLILAIIQVILGVIHITSIGSTLLFAQVIQPLVIPALSFFNTIPSLHLHVLARSNKPLMAMIFSSIFSVVYFASAVVFLPPCSAGFGDGSSYQNIECPLGTKKGVWATLIALQFLSSVGYALHFGMAWKVRRANKQRSKDEKEGRVMVVINQEEKARREEEARKRWTEIRDL